MIQDQNLQIAINLSFSEGYSEIAMDELALALGISKNVIFKQFFLDSEMADSSSSAEKTRHLMMQLLLQGIALINNDIYQQVDNKNKLTGSFSTNDEIIQSLNRLLLHGILLINNLNCTQTSVISEHVHKTQKVPYGAPVPGDV